MGAEFGIAYVEVEGDGGVADVEAIGACGTGVRPGAKAWFVLVEEGGFVFELAIALVLAFVEIAIVVGSFCIYLVLFLVAGPHTVDRDLRDASTIAIPVVELGGVGVSTQTDDIALSKETAEVLSLLGVLLAAMEDPTATVAIHGEERSVDEDEGVASMGALGKEALYLGIIGVVEVDGDIDIGTYPEAERGLRDVLPQLLGHALRHVFVIDAMGIHTTDVVIAHNGDEGKTTQFALEVVHHIVQHPLMHNSTAAVTLHEVAHLKGHARVFVNQTCGTLHHTGATLAPHLAIALELGTLYLVQPIHLLHIQRMVLRGWFCIVVRIAQDDHIIGLTASAFGLKGKEGHGCQGHTARCKKFASIHSFRLFVLQI